MKTHTLTGSCPSCSWLCVCAEVHACKTTLNNTQCLPYSDVYVPVFCILSLFIAFLYSAILCSRADSLRTLACDSE